MRAKADYMHTFGVDTVPTSRAHSRCSARFTEGMPLFASFAMLLNFPRHNKMNGMGQIVSLVGARREPALRRHHQAVPCRGTAKLAR